MRVFFNRIARAALASLTLVVAAALLSTPAAHAQTWDGGGANDNFNTANNWNPNGVPSNNGNAGLTFGGTTRLTPVVNVDYDVHSITFNNTAAPFFIGQANNSTLTVRGGGVTNNDANSMIFDVPVSFAASGSINAASGPLSFDKGIALGTSTVTVSGGFNTVIGPVSGTGQFIRNGAGFLGLDANGILQYDLTINSGDVVYGNTTSETPVFGNLSTINLNGGTLTMSDFMGLDVGLVTSGQFNKAAAATFDLGFNKEMTIQGGGDATFLGSYPTASQSTYRVTGAGSTFTLTNFEIRDNAGVEVLDAGAMSVTGAFNMTEGSNSVVVDGPGSTFAVTGFLVVNIGETSGASTMAFRNGAFGNFGGNTNTLRVGGAGTGIFLVESGADVQGRNLRIGTIAGGAGAVTVTGVGSTLQTVSTGTVEIGSAGGSSGTVSLNNGGELIASGPLLIRQTGTLNVNGGFLTMAEGQPITKDGTINFNSGRITLGQGLSIGGASSLLGVNLALTPGRAVEVLAPGTATTVAFPGSLVIDGGILRTNSLLNQGGFIDLRRGMLDLTGPLNFNVAPAGPLGPVVTLGPGMTLEATNATTLISPDSVLTIDGGNFSTDSLTLNANGSVLIEAGVAIVQSATTVASDAVLTVRGGSFSTQDLTNNGTFLIEGGTASASNTTNAAGARILVQGGLSLGRPFSNAAGARLELAGNAARITSTGAIQNSGLITGHGAIANPVTNNASGEIRAEAGKTLAFNGAVAPNAGKFNLLGGQLDFAKPLANSPTGQINGRGTLNFAGDFANSGLMQFTTGLTDIFGAVSQSATGKTIVSGGGAATFYSPLTNNAGAEFRVSANASATFFSPVTGGGFSGPGIKYFEAGLSSIPALHTPGSSVVESPASLTTTSIREASLTLSGAVELLPSVRGGDTSKLSALTIHPGGTFDLADNDLIVQSPDFPAITAAIAAARNTSPSHWSGPGLTSSLAATNPLFGLAAILNDDGRGNPLFTTFAGLPTSLGDALVAYTLNGDSDIDGDVDADDYARLDRGFLERRAGYRNGDIDYSNSINLDDYALIDASFMGQTALSSGVAVAIPEPTSACLLILGIALLSLPRRVNPLRK